MATGKTRILLVEDDLAVRDTIATALRGEGYEVVAQPDAEEVNEVVRALRPHLAVLDIRLPVGPSGLDAARTIRAFDPDVAILFVTAAGEVHERLDGFEAGGDDYVTKPFSVAEVLARVRALLRRSGHAEDKTWRIVDLVVDEAAWTAVRNGHEVPLTKTEFKLLTCLGQNRGRVLSKAQLLADVWGFDDYDPNLVEVHVGTLRRKLEEHGPRLVHTVHGVGYVMRE